MEGNHYPVVRTTLRNELRVVVSADDAIPAVGLTVDYDVGVRAEPEGQAGFAHLFEHLMLQGTPSVAKDALARAVEGAGGRFNAFTRLDFTSYYILMPANGLERGIYLLADQMAGPLLSEDNLRNQVAVIKSEIRANVHNRPYSYRSWVELPKLLFGTFPNSHDGYGSYADLDSAELADASGFFEAFYSPANAVLSIAGAVSPTQAIELVERYFGDIEARPAPGRIDYSEPDGNLPVWHTIHDARAKAPTVAIGWRLPDPARLPAYLPFLVLSDILADGPTSRLRHGLITRNRLAMHVSCHVGRYGDPLFARDPSMFVCEMRLRPGVAAADAVAGLDGSLEQLARDGADGGELDRAVTRLTARLSRDASNPLYRSLAMAALELLYGRAELVSELPHLLAEVTDSAIRAAADALRERERAILVVGPGQERSEE
jgi:predicted Zn-dependent peptidase